MKWSWMKVNYDIKLHDSSKYIEAFKSLVISDKIQGHLTTVYWGSIF